MLTRKFLFSFLILVVFVLTGGWNPGTYVAKSNEEMYGTWTNMSEEGAAVTRVAQKQVCYPGGWKMYSLMSDTSPGWEGTEKIESKWTDSDGNIWYRTFGTITKGWMKGYKIQWLRKLSKAGTVIESVPTTVAEFDSSFFPTDVDPKNEDYALFNREGN